MRSSSGVLSTRLPPLAALLISLGLALAILVADLTTGPLITLGMLKTAVLMVTASARSRRLLWGMTALLLAIAIGVGFVEAPHVSVDAMRTAVIGNRIITVAAVLIVAVILDAWIRADLASELAGRALEAQNQELAAREEEIIRQNEELQSQTEELERQSEELRVSNDELSHREKMLQTLLDLSRSLHVGLVEDQAMEQICETLAQLVNGPGNAAAIVLLDEQEVAGDGELHVRCHSGFGPEGLRRNRFSRERSFSQLVIEQGRSGYLEDLSLRPELEVPQPALGQPMAAVLATPLVIRGKPIGSLEVYSRERRSWSDQQIALAESLAAQTSATLENARLFQEIDRGRRRVETILESVPVGLAIVSADLRDVRFNPAGAALMGVAPGVNVAEEYGRAAWIIFQEGKQVPRERYPLCRATRGERVYPHEIEVVLPTGRRMTIMNSAAPFHDADGNVVGAVSSFIDISELKALQRELETRRREAEEASVRKTRFLAAASHDIRTPANAISLLAELLKRTADSPSMAAEIPQLAEELRQSAMSLVNLVSNVLDVTRFDTDKLELHEIDFPLQRLLDEEARQVLPLAQAKGLILDVEPADQHLYLRADRIKLGRVIGNLLGNAIKFTDRGGIRVATHRGAGGEVSVSVSDTGIGISRDNHARIFDEFWQLSDPQRSKGSGLGLAISKRLVEAMGGTITVHSEADKGSTFTVLLPASAVVPRPDPDALAASRAT